MALRIVRHVGIVLVLPEQAASASVPLDCVSSLYPYFPLLLGWIAGVDRARCRVGTVLSYLVPYAVFLLAGWTVMLVLWYLTGVDVGPDTPLRWGG